MSVLVVDDQAINRVLVAALLRHLNLDVIEATNGREGLLAYLRHGRDRIAFVFLDLVMPVWDGFRAALSIRSAESQRGWQQVPIVAYTSEDVRQGSPIFHKCMASGFNDVVAKPMRRAQAVELLCRWLPNLRLAEQQASIGCSSTGSSGGGGCAVHCGCEQASCGGCFAAACVAATAVAAAAQRTAVGFAPRTMPNCSSGGSGNGIQLPQGSEGASTAPYASYTPQGSVTCAPNGPA